MKSRRMIGLLIALALLLAVFTLYLRPDFMRDVADMTYACF